jgi:ribosome maturation factor RimP
MKLLNVTEQNIHTITSTLENEGSRYICIEYIESDGYKVIDIVIRDEQGNNIDDPIICEEITTFLDEIED